MKNLPKRIYGFLLAVALLLSPMGTFSSSGAQAAAANRYNVVFVIDASGSMLETDRSLWRYEAIDLFLGLATDAGNHMGAVIFNDRIIAAIQMQEINGKDIKTTFSQNLRNSPIQGDTDIGGAVLKAVEMLDAERNPELPSVIILLSDGNTDFPYDNTGEYYKQSKENKEKAIERARENQYSVFSVCLNENNKANTAELADISKATGGQFVEVGKAEDLKEVFGYFYNIIYSTETISIVDERIPANGILETPFSVPFAGVEELNIIISTLNPETQYTLFRPDGNGFTEDELSAFTIQVKTFSIIKIPQPPGGVWKIQARGNPDDAVKIDMVYNSSFSVRAQAEPAGPGYELGDQITFTASIFSNGEEMRESSSYAVYSAILTVFNASDNSEVAKTLMQAEQFGYRADYSANEAGDFYVTVTVMFEGLEKSSEKIFMTVNSEILQSTEIPTTAAVLSQPAVTQPVQSSAAQSSSASGKSMGSILSLAAMARAAVLGLALLALLIRLIWPRIKPSVFQGNVMIYAFDNINGMMESPRTIQPTRGREKLGRYITEGGGIDLDKTYLMADKSPNYIWLVSDSGLYSGENAEKKEKKICLYSGSEITVSRNRDLESGLRITYMSGNIMY